MRSYRVSSGFALMLAGAVAAAACSGKVAPAKGQVMVVLQSDMSIPKDFNRVRVDISVRGQKAFSETYIADESGGITLPGTIAVVAGEEDAPPVEVKVVGINRDGEAQTFSKAVTTIPRTRIATLRIPMQWLCTGQVLQIGEGADSEYESRCNPEKGVEKSCIAGSCVPVDIAEKDLPTYSPPEVFGGGQFPNDPSGECFDVQACFKLGVDLQPDLDPDSDTYCQAAIAVPEDFEVNFAVKTPPGGAGVCDDDDDEAPCYVVLDQSETFGWTPLEGAEPPAVVDGGTGGTGGASGGKTGGTGGAAPPGGSSSGGVFPGAGAASGGQATAGTGTGGVPPVGAPKRVTTGGWFGDVFTYRSPGSDIMVDGTEPGFPICVSGTVAPTANDYAMVGFYLQQDMGSDAQFIAPVDPGAGVHVQITDNLGGATPLRVVLTNSFTPTHTSGYCTAAVEGPTHYLWSNFDENCEAGGDGPFFDGSTDQILGLAVAVPGSDGPIPFDFCIEGVTEDLPIGQRLSPGLQPQSVPAPPGVRPQQAGGADGSVVVQFPTAVCDRLNDDPDLRLRGTAACDKKTEQVPICGPWSSVPAPQVPNPDGMLPGGMMMSGEGGAGGMSGGDAGGEGGGSGGPIPIPKSCKAPDPAEHANPGIASFDQDVLTPDLDMLDNRTGRAFSVGHGVCQGGQLGKIDGGALSTPKALRLFGSACDTSFVDGNSIALVVPLASVPGPSQQATPSMMCVYDSSFYAGIKFWAKDDQSRDVSVTLLTPDNVPVGDPVPGGACDANCNLVRVNIPLTPNWQEFQFPFNQFEIDPSQLMGIKFEPLATSEIYFEVDEIHFFEGTPP